MARIYFYRTMDKFGDRYTPVTMDGGFIVENQVTVWADADDTLLSALNVPDPSRHKVVVDSEGAVVVNNGNLILWDEQDKNQFEVEMTDEVMTIFGLKNQTEVTESQMSQDLINNNITTAGCSGASETETGCPGGAVNWKGRDDAVKHLIFLWKENKHIFKSTSIKNDAAWNKVADKLKSANLKWNYTGKQCQDKIKYIRKEYVKTKDWNKQTGNAPKSCPFFDELEEILGDKPCVKPVALASSSIKRPPPKDHASEECSSESEGTEEKNEKKQQPKKKKTRVQKEIESWTETLRRDAEKREEAREKRFGRGLQVYQEVMQKLIDKL